MSPTTVHLINHTHWDREWFLTSVYTSRWIPPLIENLERLGKNNPQFTYLFDGQTLVIEDLLTLKPEFNDRIDALIASGQLMIGPYYCQPDWQLTAGELLLRNLVYGQEDVARHGGTMRTGWLVDTFGHISQSPQIHRLFGIEATHVWRGVPRMEPYFWWESPDGSRILTINLFGGYRNLFGITHAPEVAVKRLQAEVNKLRPYYPTADIPLFDGYDLDVTPEDPLRFYEETGGVEPDIELRQSTPTLFAREIKALELSLPILSSELNSGKFGATFPGTLSARTYLKIAARDCESMLFQLCEPLGSMAWLRGADYRGEQYEQWGRALLQNAVHDCICGVSIDQVHEKMEYSYRQTFAAMSADLERSLETILAHFAPGVYAISTNPFQHDHWQVAEGQVVHVQSNGIGVWPVEESVDVASMAEQTGTFSWTNDFFHATVDETGVVAVGEGTYGALVISAELGDTYSDELGEKLGAIHPSTPLIVEEKSARHAVISYKGEFQAGERQVSVGVRLRFDQSPLLRWEVDLASAGTNLRVEMVFQSGIRGEIVAGMPFDIVQRPAADLDLMPLDPPAELAGILLGQRELNRVSTFPFHDFVVLAAENATVGILARGVRAYAADQDGTVTIPLRRAVEWLTKADLQNRVGDAGPFFYVPDARCERQVRHELAVVLGNIAADSIEFQTLNAAYQNPPLIVRHRGNGSERSWSLFQAGLPMSSLQVRNGDLLARLFNPTAAPISLPAPYPETDVWGSGSESIQAVPPKKIVTLCLPQQAAVEKRDPVKIDLLNRRVWRVGENQGLPDPEIIAELGRLISGLETQIQETKTQLADSRGDEQLRWQHKYYVQNRERLEFELSRLLNLRKLDEGGALRYEYLYLPDAQITAIGAELNQMRIKRRIFDYVVQLL